MGPEEEKEYNEAARRSLTILAQQATTKMSEGALEITIRSLAQISKLSTSMLIVAGTAVTLSISNAADVVSVLGSGTLAWMLSLMLVSALLGFAGKIFAVIADTFISASTDFSKLFEEATAEYYRVRSAAIKRDTGLTTENVPSLDHDELEAIFIRSLPRGIQKGVNETLHKRQGTQESSDSDSSDFYRVPLTCTLLQLLSVALQSAFLLLGFAVAIAGFE